MIIVTDEGSVALIKDKPISPVDPDARARKKTGTTWPGYLTVDDLLYDPENIKLMCPAGHISTNCYSEVLHNYQLNKPSYAFRLMPTLCNVCPLKARCVQNRAGRRVYAYCEPYFRMARERLATEAGRQAYHSRYKIEQKVADLTRYCGLRTCRHRGLGRAGIHTLLASTVCNIKRMAKLLWGKPENHYLESVVAG
jgi:hypothetical protein